MKALIKVANPARGMYAAHTEDGEFVIFELLESDQLEIGDVVEHEDFHAMGAEEFRNVTHGGTLSVSVKNIVGSADQARRQCFLT